MEAKTTIMKMLRSIYRNLWVNGHPTKTRRVLSIDLTMAIPQRRTGLRHCGVCACFPVLNQGYAYRRKRDKQLKGDSILEER